MVFVSVIVPFNKSKRYLDDCLSSLGFQRMSDMEVILVVNGVDECIDDLLNDYEEKLKLMIIDFDYELGVSKARNEGLKVASGEYVYFMDSDDYLYDDALDRLVEAARNTNADFINGERIATLFIRQRFEEELEKPHVIPLKGKEDDPNFSIRLLVGKNNEKQELLSALHCLIRRDLISNITFDENKRYFADYEFMLDVLDCAESFCGVEDAIYAKRIRDDSVNLTSLNQEVINDDYSLFLKQYFVIKQRTTNNPKEQFRVLYRLVIDKLLKFHYHYFAYNYHYEKDERWRSHYIYEMAEIACDFDPDELSLKEKFEIRALQQKDFGKYARLVKNRFSFVNSKKALKDSDILKQYIYESRYAGQVCAKTSFFLKASTETTTQTARNTYMNIFLKTTAMISSSFGY